MEVAKVGVWEGLMKTHQKSLKALFSRKSSNGDPNESQEFRIPHFSPLANSVVSRSSRILQIPTEELQHHFGTEPPENAKELQTYARHFLEFCSYQALQIVSKRSDYLSDKEFRRLTFDMMLAWEDPVVKSKPVQKVRQPNVSFPFDFVIESSINQEVEDESGWSLFYSSSTNMAVQVDEEKTVGPEAFARIAPACAAVADIITVHNLFDALAASTGHRLHFLVYDKYIRNLDKIIKAAKNALVSSIGNLKLAEGEIVLDVDGSVPTQPVLQHIGISAWPGRLTLTNYALYFESLGVGLYDKAVRYDLATDMKQVIKPEMTGPLGARIFDKAVMYKSTSIADPVYFEFPEFKGSSRRDYWLDIGLEIFYAHRFIRKNNLKGTQKSEALSRAILGIFRYHAIREAFRFSSSQYKTLLPYNLAESLPRGDFILETLLSRLILINADTTHRDVSGGSSSAKQVPKASPVSLLALLHLGFILQKEVMLDEKAIIVGDICVGETNPLETAVKQSVSDTSSAEAAQATIDQVKVEGIDTNVAVMKELLFPVIAIASRLQLLASWEESYKSIMFMLLTCYCIFRGWIRYILPFLFLFVAVIMLWRRHFNKGKPLEPFRVTAPPNRNTVEQLLTLQEIISQVEALIQSGNIVLLKIRALMFAVLPRATDGVVLLLVFLAGVFAFVPFKYIIMVIFLEAYTREMPYRKESSDKIFRRAREWWVRIPAAPVQLIKPESDKKKKS
ncbi:hypothetical protein F8388_021061 [Cannabis sativa]|uniref:DUF639 domain-containing protein n=2 Tax=Cannabis sativa TaxID=3483 RepID=A0A7J6ERS7_CANSA|nr:hypothetical protein G4B88_000402 [Cannabis sativa]KAF4388231.1 hypothetical protein F8388_021061 [Cannabis sativa]